MTALILPPSPLPQADDRFSLSAAELRAAVLDGELVALGDGYLSIDSVALPSDRAASLADLRADQRLFAERLTAAWIHGWCPEPRTHTAAASIAARVPSGVRRRLGARELIITDTELVTVGGVRVTSPVRTLVDLAREDDATLPRDELARIVDESGISVAEVCRFLASARKAPHAARARLRLSAVADAVHVVDRVDAPDRVQHAVEVRDIAHLEHELRDRQAVA